MKLKDILKEENWKAEKSVITLDGEKVGDYSYDRDSDSFWMDNIKGSGQKSFDTTSEMLAYIKAHKADYLKARKAYVSKGHMHEAPTDDRFIYHKADASLLSSVKSKLSGINILDSDYVYQTEVKINKDGDVAISFFRKPRFKPKSSKFN